MLGHTNPSHLYKEEADALPLGGLFGQYKEMHFSTCLIFHILSIYPAFHSLGVKVLQCSVIGHIPVPYFTDQLSVPRSREAIQFPAIIYERSHIQ